MAISRVTHVLSLALWSGGALFFSYLAAPRIFGYLRDQMPSNPPPGVQGLTPEIGRRLAGDTVGAIFPTYFAAQVVVGLSAVATGLVLAHGAKRWEKIRCGLALAALVIVTLHAATVYPRSVRIRQAQYQAQAAGDESKADELHKAFAMLHGISQLLNMATIVLVVLALILAGLSPDPSQGFEASVLEQT